MRLGPVCAPGPPRVIEPLLVFAALYRKPPGLHHRAAAPGLARCASLRRSRFILLLARALAVRALAALGFGHEDGQLPRDDRAVSRLRGQIDDDAAGTHRRVLVRHPGKARHTCAFLEDSGDRCDICCNKRNVSFRVPNAESPKKLSRPSKSRRNNIPRRDDSLNAR